MLHLCIRDHQLCHHPPALPRFKDDLGSSHLLGYKRLTWSKNVCPLYAAPYHKTVGLYSAWRPRHATYLQCSRPHMCTHDCANICCWSTLSKQRASWFCSSSQAECIQESIIMISRWISIISRSIYQRNIILRCCQAICQRCYYISMNLKIISSQDQSQWPQGKSWVKNPRGSWTSVLWHIITLWSGVLFPPSWWNG